LEGIRLQIAETNGMNGSCIVLWRFRDRDFESLKSLARMGATEWCGGCTRRLQSCAGFELLTLCWNLSGRGKELKSSSWSAMMGIGADIVGLGLGGRGGGVFGCRRSATTRWVSFRNGMVAQE
jgi:hypothetical protein